MKNLKINFCSRRDLIPRPLDFATSILTTRPRGLRDWERITPSLASYYILTGSCDINHLKALLYKSYSYIYSRLLIAIIFNVTGKQLSNPIAHLKDCGFTNGSKVMLIGSKVLVLKIISDVHIFCICICIIFFYTRIVVFNLYFLYLKVYSIDHKTEYHYFESRFFKYVQYCCLD